MSHIKVIVVFFCFLLFAAVAKAQKIEYSFGQASDVVDSIKAAVSWYKKSYHQSEFKKLNLFAGIDRCDGNLNIYISQYDKRSEGIRQLIKKTNRFISVDKDLSLPILFDTDFLAKDLDEKVFIINMNGYYIQAVRNEKYIWRVTRMNMTF